MKKLYSYIKEVADEFTNDNVPLLAAAQAYYYLLSIIPMLILMLSVLPYLNINPDTALNTINSVMPEELGNIFEDQIVDILTEPQGGLLTIGIIGTIWSASNGMNAFIKAQNEAYNVKVTRPFWKARLISIGLTFGMIVAVVIALALPVFGDAIIEFMKNYVALPEQMELLMRILRWVVSLVLIAAILSVLYHVAPNVRIPYKFALPGAVFATVAWQITSFGFSVYIANFGNYSETYGSLGGIIILMIWFFLIGIILVVGAEINAIRYRKKTGLTPGKGGG